MTAFAYYLSATCYLALALAHSLLGERALLRPLFRQSWQLGSLPRPFAVQLLRWAWHVTSAAWVAAAALLAAAGAGVQLPALVPQALGALALVSALMIYLPGRGAHPAWAIFTAAGLASLAAAHGWPGPGAARVAGGAVALVLSAIAALHGYWALGGTRGLAAALPQRRDGERTFKPSAALTWAVALVLLATAAVVASAAGIGPALPQARALGLAASAVFLLRMIGDFRFAGLFKRVHSTEFARYDSLLYSPLCGALAAACLLAAW